MTNSQRRDYLFYQPLRNARTLHRQTADVAPLPVYLLLYRSKSIALRSLIGLQAHASHVYHSSLANDKYIANYVK
mgnify:CR=1 FL=1